MCRPSCSPRRRSCSRSSVFSTIQPSSRRPHRHRRATRPGDAPARSPHRARRPLRSRAAYRPASASRSPPTRSASSSSGAARGSTRLCLCGSVRTTRFARRAVTAASSCAAITATSSTIRRARRSPRRSVAGRRRASRLPTGRGRVLCVPVRPRPSRRPCGLKKPNIPNLASGCATTTSSSPRPGRKGLCVAARSRRRAPPTPCRNSARSCAVTSACGSTSANSNGATRAPRAAP